MHFSVFTPESFLILIYYLTAFGLFPYKCEQFWPTERETFEFNVVLKRTSPYHPKDEQEKERNLRAIIGFLDRIKDDTLQKDVIQEVYRFVDRDTFEQLVQERETMKAERNSIQRALAETQRELASVYNSRVWRITPLLRVVAKCWDRRNNPA